jgi:FKBP-type peptidyl-prolyl cis-trans isomerase 2
MSKVEKNNKVKVHYTGRLTNGEQFDSSVGRDPLEFTVGAGQMIPGFDSAVEGMELNEKKTITLAPEQAYGPRHDQLINEVPRTQLPSDMKPEVGQSLVASSQDGRQQRVQVTEVSETSITVDANHPLAGKELIFDIELVEIIG